MTRLYTYTKAKLPSDIIDKANSNYIVPVLSDDELRRLYHKLRPILSKVETVNYAECCGQGEVKYLLKGLHVQDLRDVYVYCVLKNYICSDHRFYSRVTEKLDNYNVCPVDDFYCLHKFTSPDMFDATIAEILAQVPKNILGQANAFELAEYPQSLEDAAYYPEIFSKGYHLSRVRAYNIERKN